MFQAMEQNIWPLPSSFLVMYCMENQLGVGILWSSIEDFAFRIIFLPCLSTSELWVECSYS